MLEWMMYTGKNARLCEHCASVLGEMKEGEKTVATDVCPVCNRTDFPLDAFSHVNPTYLFIDMILVALPAGGLNCAECGKPLFKVKAVPEPDARSERALKWAGFVSGPFCRYCDNPNMLGVMFDRHIHFHDSPRIDPPNEGWQGIWERKRIGV